MNGAELIEALRTALAGLGKPWALFANGTFVVLTEPGSDCAAQAKAILVEFGRVGDGSATDDTGATFALGHGRGWLVSSNHGDIVTFVSRDEVAPRTARAAIGRLGRAKRAQDVAQLHVLHVEGEVQGQTGCRA
jgi:hypothetical protein